MKMKLFPFSGRPEHTNIQLHPVGWAYPMLSKQGHTQLFFFGGAEKWKGGGDMELYISFLIGNYFPCSRKYQRQNNKILHKRPVNVLLK